MRARILDLQRRLHEAGRIRIGHQVDAGGGRKRPERLRHFRLTSSSQRALEAVAAIHGGTVAPWKEAPTPGQFELYTEAAELPVIVPPDEMAFSQAYELWSAGGCQRRCDGQREVLSDGPCLCDPEERECTPHTRLSVMLRGVPGVGLWRIDTQGFYAASELGGAVDMGLLLKAALGRAILPARLRVEARTVKRPDPKNAAKVIARNFVVPVLDFDDVDVSAVALAGLPAADGAEVVSLPGVPEPPRLLAPASGVTPIPPATTPALAQQFAELEEQPAPPRRRNSPPPLPRTGLAPRTAAQAQAEAPAEAAEEPRTASRRRRTAAAAADPAPAPAEPEQLANGTTPRLSVPPAAPETSPETRRMLELLREAKIAGADRLSFASFVCERTLGSSKDMAAEEVATVTKRLLDHTEGRARIARGEDGSWSITPAAAVQAASEPEESIDDDF